MQSFSVDGLSREEVERLQRALPQFARPSPVDGLYWVTIPESVLAPVQRAHTDCQPHYFAVEVGEDFISFEFLVRTFQRVRCDCIAPATNQQRLFLLELAKRIFEAAGVSMRK